MPASSIKRKHKFWKMSKNVVLFSCVLKKKKKSKNVILSKLDRYTSKKTAHRLMTLSANGKMFKHVLHLHLVQYLGGLLQNIGFTKPSSTITK